MNSTFSFERLWGLIRKQWIENNRFYTLGTLALLGLMGIAMIFFWIVVGGNHYDEKDAYIIYLVGLFVTGTVYGSISFSVLGQKEKGQYWLAFPASHEEKLITSVLFTSVIFFVIYTVIFLVVKIGAQAYIESYVANNKWASFDKMKWDENFGKAMPYIIWGFFCLQGLFILGSVYFKQFSFIKTTIFVSVLVGLLTLLFAKISMTMFSNVGFQWEGLELRQPVDENNYGVYKSYSLGTGLSKFLEYFLTYCWLPFFWLITLFRLKEKEI